MGDFGLTPEKSAFGMHATIVMHYLEGGWFPEKGAQEMVFAAQKAIAQSGGESLSGMEVEEIVVKNGRACGVKAKNIMRNRDSEYYEAPIIISDAGAYNTYTKLIPETHRPEFVSTLKDIPATPSAVSLYIGLKESPEKLGIGGKNYWVFSDYDHEKAIDGKPGEQFYYLSFPSLKDPAAEAHTAEMLSFIDVNKVAEWNNTAWRQRGQEYESWKETVSQALLGRLEQDFEGFKELVDFYELATSLTYEFFQGSYKGGF